MATPTSTVTAPAPLAPADELAKIQSDPTFSGGQYYGRVPNGIADLVNGGVVPNSSAHGSNTATQPEGVASAIANSTVRRYTGSSTTVGETPAETASNAYLGGSSGTPPVQPDQNAIRQSAMNDIQSEIDGYKNTYGAMITQAKTEGVANLGKGRATEARSGILGSDFGGAQQDKIQGATDTKVASLNAQMNAAIAQAMSKAQVRGDSLAKLAQDESDKQSASYIASLTQHANDARAEVTSLAKSGVPLGALSQEEYNTLIEHTGYSPAVFNAVYNASLPQNAQRKYTYEKIGNSIIPIYTDPTTGKPVAESPITPPAGSNFDGFMVAPDGTPLFYNKTTGKAQVAEIAGTDKTNFSKPASGKGSKPAPDTGYNPPPFGVLTDTNQADILGGAWLKTQPNFTPEDMQAYMTNPAFHEKVNAAAAAAKPGLVPPPAAPKTKAKAAAKIS